MYDGHTARKPPTVKWPRRAIDGHTAKQTIEVMLTRLSQIAKSIMVEVELASTYCYLERILYVYE